MSYEINDLLDQAMTAGDLRRLLEGVADDVPVIYAADYGDRGRTQQAFAVEDALELAGENLYTTGYSNSGVAVSDGDDRVIEHDEETANRPVLLIK